MIVPRELGNSKMKLNLGSGHSKAAGYINVDRETESHPDILWDLEIFPWPWDDNSVDEVVFNHSLEHLGARTDVFLRIISEVYRICRHEAIVRVNVPHPRHDNFLDDPTHVRPVTPTMFGLFNREQNDAWKAAGAANSPLAHYLNVDFVVIETERVLEEPFSSQFTNGEITAEELVQLERQLNNIVKAFHIVMRVRKS